MEVNKIIISNLRGIGDTLMITPLLMGIKKLYPEINLTVVTYNHTLPLTSRMPFVDEAYGFEKNLMNHISLIKKIFNTDMVYCVDGSYRTSLIYALAMIKERIGLPYKRKKYLTKVLAYEEWMDYDYEPYVHAMLFKQGTGIDITKLDNWNRFYYPEADDMEKDAAIKTLVAGGWTPREGYIVCSLESDTWQKDWPIESWMQLFDELKDIKRKIVIVGLKSQILNDIIFPDNVIDLRGKTTLIEMGYIVQNADLMIAVCSLFVHVAYAFNIPIIGLYGPQPVWRGAPPSIFASICSTAECAPCALYSRGEHCQNPFCMDSITVEHVFDKIKVFYKL